MPYRDLGLSLPKTLGRPDRRVKASCVPHCVPPSTDHGGANIRLWWNRPRMLSAEASPTASSCVSYYIAYDDRLAPRSECPPAETASPSSDEGEAAGGRPRMLSAGPFSNDFASSLRPASMARCTGSSGGFASYRRDPLVDTHSEPVEAGQSQRLTVGEGAARAVASGHPLVTTFSTRSSWRLRPDSIPRE